MLSPEKFKKLLTTDYTDLYTPLELPRNLTDEFKKVLLSGDNDAIEKYFREVILPYCYSADLENKQVTQWDHARAVKNGRKGGQTHSEDLDELHQEWCNTRDSMKRKNKGISMRKIARAIWMDQEGCYYAHRPDPTKKYSISQIRTVISTK
jgi:hypothetical protein